MAMQTPVLQTRLPAHVAAGAPTTVAYPQGFAQGVQHGRVVCPPVTIVQSPAPVPVTASSLAPAPASANGLQRAVYSSAALQAPTYSSALPAMVSSTSVVRGPASSAQFPMARKRQYVNSKCLAIRYNFNGDFQIRGRPIVLNVDPIDSERSHMVTGLRVWDGGIVLAKYLEQYVPALLQAGKKPQLQGLDLGCGTGIAGLTFALCGQRALLSDLAGLQAEATQANIAQNQGHIAAAGGSAAFEVLDWERLPDRARFGFFDLVFAGDVVWHETLVDPFVKAISWAASGPGAGEILLSHKVRDEESVHLFEQQVVKAGFVIQKKVQSEQALGDIGHPDVFVYHMRLR